MSINKNSQPITDSQGEYVCFVRQKILTEVKTSKHECFYISAAAVSKWGLSDFLFVILLFLPMPSDFCFHVLASAPRELLKERAWCSKRAVTFHAECEALEKAFVKRS